MTAEVLAVGLAAVVEVRLEEHVVVAVVLVVGGVATAADLLAVVDTVQSVGCVVVGTVQMIGFAVVVVVSEVEFAAAVALLKVGSAAAVVVLVVGWVVVGVDWTAAAETPEL